MSQFPPLTPKASELLRQLLDTHWDLTQMELLRENNQEQIMRTWETRNHLKQIKSQLMEEMGMDAYHYFMQAGRDMFTQP